MMVMVYKPLNKIIIHEYILTQVKKNKGEVKVLT